MRPSRTELAALLRPVRLAGIILGLMAAGCAPRGPQLPPTEPGVEGARTLIRLLGERACPTNLAADLEIVVAPVGRPRVLLTGGLRAAWPDRIRVQARAAAFVPIASVAVEGDTACLSLPRQGAYWRGTGNRFMDGGVAGAASSLLWLLCPIPVLQSLVDPILDRTPSGWTIRGRLAGNGPPQWAEIRLPADRSRVAEIILRDADGKIRIRCKRLGDREVAGASLPNAVRVQSGERGGWVEARILKPRPDPSQPAGLFRFAPGAGQRTLGDQDLIDLMTGLGLDR
jgi:hypothetical protein